MTTTNPGDAAPHRAVRPDPEGFRAAVATVAAGVAAALADVNDEPAHRAERSTVADWLDMHRMIAAAGVAVFVVLLVFLALGAFL